MKLDPFIEAEKIAGHSVAKTLWPVRGLPFRLLPAPQWRPLCPRRHRRRADRSDHGSTTSPRAPMDPRESTRSSASGGGCGGDG